MKGNDQDDFICVHFYAHRIEKLTFASPWGPKRPQDILFGLRWLTGPRRKWYDIGNTTHGECLLKCPAIDAEIVYSSLRSSAWFNLGLAH